MLIGWQPLFFCEIILNADKHSPASSVRSTKWRVRGGCLCQWELKAPTDRSRSGLRMSALQRLFFENIVCKLQLLLLENEFS